MPITTYCTWPDVTNRLSAAGAAFRVDDDPSTKTDVLESAAIEVNGYLQLRYGTTALAASNWVRFKTRDVAVYLLCLRRNHPVPKSVQARYDAAVEQMEQVAAGMLNLPDVAEPKENAPVLSNQRVTMWPFPRPQNVEGTSTGTREGYTPHNDNLDNFDYSI